MSKKPWVIKLDIKKEGKKELEKLRRKSSDYRNLRALMVLLNSEGQIASEIAKQLKVHHHTVRKVLKSYQTNGVKGLYRKYSPGRPGTLRKLFIDKLKVWIKKIPQDYGYPQQYWTTPLLIDLFEKKTGNSLNDSTARRALKDAGFSWKRPKKTVPQNAPTKEEKIKIMRNIFEKIKEFAYKDDTEIFLVDETHFSTEPYYIKGWFPIGEHFPPKHSPKKRMLHSFWRLESQEKTILLEEFSER